MAPRTDDVLFMRRALQLAARAEGLTSPNPVVGAVVVKDGSVIGEGYHRAAGSPHAEVEALRAAGERAREATLYVTLEPCTHQGRTAPCVPVVLASGIGRVVIATADPNPAVNGRGIAALAEAGVEVAVGILEPEARQLNRAFFTYMTERRPFVTLKAGLSLDGKIAAWDMTSRWITGEAARQEAHRLRSRADAVAVGIGTVLADDPLLTARLPEPWPREPLRVVVDSRARTPLAARVLTVGRPERTIIAVTDLAPPDRIRMLEGRGVNVLVLPERDGRVDLPVLLKVLAERETTWLLLEGGGELNAGFLEAGLVDRVALFVAPILVGGTRAPSLVGGAGRSLKEAFRLSGLSVRRIGDDLLIEADVGQRDVYRDR